MGHYDDHCRRGVHGRRPGGPVGQASRLAIDAIEGRPGPGRSRPGRSRPRRPGPGRAHRTVLLVELVIRGSAARVRVAVGR
jgi:hypothetical protein